MTQSADHFSAEAAASAPVQFSYQITPTCFFNTTVSGDSRNVAAVSIVNGSVPVWGVTLIQAQPTGTLTYDLMVGSDTIKAGTTFTLTVPTTNQMGMVVVNTTISSPTNPNGTPFQASIANWPLVSSL